MSARNPFFIVGLPRSRTAWLANLLTWGDAFCHHEAFRECATAEDLPKVLERSGAACVGDADPMLPLFAGAVARLYPEARYVVVERDPAQCKASYERVLAGLGVRQSRFAQLHSHFQEFRQQLPASRRFLIAFNDLSNAHLLRALWQFCVPTVPFPLARVEMLVRLKVEAHPESVAAHTDAGRLRELSRHVEPIGSSRPSALHEEYQRVLAEMCGGNKEAFRWLQQLLEVQLTWDHLVDGDPLDIAMADRVFEALVVDWAQNPFWDKYKMYLLPVLSNAISAWRESDRLDEVKGYDGYTEIPLAVAFVLGGQTLASRYSPAIRRLAHQIHKEDQRKDKLCR